ncbi:MAG: hypothetical protein J0I92_17595 [Phyllobacterium sp.]|nr:hypothetical protein [Phyllobacterium sp.]
MAALLSFLVSNPTILAIGSGIIAMLVAWMRGRLSGAAAERTKRALKEATSTTEGQKIDDAVAGRSPDDNRGRLAKWSKS